MATNRLRFGLASMRGLSALDGLSNATSDGRRWLDEIADTCHRLSSLSHRSWRGGRSKRREPGRPAVALADKLPRRLIFRHGEKEGVYYRSERLFAVGHRWYFATREGRDIGPYQDRREAELALAVFVSQKILDEASSTVQRIARARDATGFDAMVAELVEFFRERGRRSQTGSYVWALKRLQMLRARGEAETHSAARTAALQYVMAKSDNLDGLLAPE